LPRRARLVGGEHAWGVLAIGALQAFVYLDKLRPFRHPVIGGAELVSFSAILTARKAGTPPVALLEEGPRTTARWPCSWAPRLLGSPLRFGTRIADIRAKERVEAVEVEDGEGRRDRIACDGVPIECLPEIRPTAGAFGEVDGVPVTASVVDQHATLYGHDCRAAGDAEDHLRHRRLRALRNGVLHPASPGTRFSADGRIAGGTRPQLCHRRRRL
jgi:hypothetical protein